MVGQTELCVSVCFVIYKALFSCYLGPAVVSCLPASI